MKKGIPVLTSYAGVVDVKNGRPTEFVDLIAYAGSSLDPMKVFMARRVTSVANAVSFGSGSVLANVREVPIAAAEQVRDHLDESIIVGFGGLIKIGDAGEPILGCPIGSGKIGVALYAGVNGLLAAEELGFRIKTEPISMMLDYSRFRNQN
jgi:repressor of nif and glnA expression